MPENDWTKPRPPIPAPVKVPPMQPYRNGSTCPPGCPAHGAPR